MNFINKIKSFVVNLIIQIALFFDKIETTWIEKVLELTQAIKKALDNKIVQIGLQLAKVDNVILDKFALYIPDIQEKLKYLSINWEDCKAETDNLKKIECFITSLAKAALAPEQRNQALLQIALTLLEKMGIKIKGGFFSKQLSVETAYNVLKKKSK